MGEFLVGHDVMKDYMFRFLTGNSCSLIGFYEAMKMFVESASIIPLDMINYQQLRMSWYSFLGLLDLDYKAGFLCQDCGIFPDVLICDATTLGFRREFAQHLDIPIDCLEDQYLSGSSFAERTLIPTKKTRELLTEYHEKEITEAHFLKLYEAFKLENIVVAEFVLCCKKEFESWHYIPKPILCLIDCMASLSSVSSYFPLPDELFKVIIEVNEQSIVGPQSLILLQKIAPIVFAAVSVLKLQKLPKQWFELFELLKNKSTAAFPSAAHQLPASHSLQTGGISYFPNWPVLCIRGTYMQDKKNLRQQENCTKKQKGHPTLMPGLFTIYREHGICQGFEVMGSQESPNIPFKIFRTRLPKAPEAIVYDNSCNLHAYCLNRDPGFFRSCTFVVDRFHWKNHKGCAQSYNMRLYPRFEGINSQINEQRNAELKRLKNQVSYMSEDHFIQHCRLFLWHRNLRTSGKLPKLC